MEELADRLAALDLVAPQAGRAPGAAHRLAGTASRLPRPPGATPLRTGPLRTTPLRTTPLRTTPLRTTPLRTTPLRTTPLRTTPLRTTPLRGARSRCTLPPSPTGRGRAHRVAPPGSAAGTAESSTIAVQAIPSARPIGPRPSARVALTLTGAPTTPASVSAILPT